MSKQKSLVALAKEPTIQGSVTRVFDLLGGIGSMIEAGDTVVIKPNIGHAAPPETAVCTNPEVVRADINIVDAIYAASGFSPHTPVPLEVGCILGSRDPVAVDRVACDLVGIDPDMVDYFRVAEEANMGNTRREDIELVGEKLEDCYKKMWIPYIGDMSTRWPEYDVRCQGACSSCQALLALNMETLKAIGEYEKCSDTVIVAGSKNTVGPEVPDEKLVLHGNCAFRHLKDHPNARWIKGCPPGEGCLYNTVVQHKLYDAQTDEQMTFMRAQGAKDAPLWRAYVEKQAAEFYGKEQ